MRYLVFTWPYALVFWLVFIWAFAPEFSIVRRPNERSSKQDAHSKRFIEAGQGLGVFAAFAIAGFLPSAALPNPVLCFWAGIGITIAGSLLRRHCWRMLGQSFTGAVIVKAEQTVVERGAYRYIRHPSYTGGVLMLLGIGFALGNWLSILMLLLSSAAVYSYRVRVEEAALVAVLGEPYRRYMTRTKRFVPYVY